MVVLTPEGEVEGPRLVAVLNEYRAGRGGWSDWVSVYAADGNRRALLVRLAWRDAASFERSVRAELPLEQRGLNARADVVEGPYRHAAGSVVERLRDAPDVARWLSAITDDGRSGRAEEHPQSRALVRKEGAQDKAVAVAVPVERERGVEAVDAEFSPAVVVAARSVASGDVRIPGSAELEGRLATDIFHAMVAVVERAAAERSFPGAAWLARTSVLTARDWLVLGVAVGIDVVTGGMATGTIVPNGWRWLFGMVGVALVGGMRSEAKSAVDKVACLGFAAAWGTMVAFVAASDETLLRNAQALFPKGEAVSAAMAGVELANGDLEAAKEEVRRRLAALQEELKGSAARSEAPVVALKADSAEPKLGAPAPMAGAGMSGRTRAQVAQEGRRAAEAEARAAEARAREAETIRSAGQQERRDAAVADGIRQARIGRLNGALDDAYDTRKQAERDVVDKGTALKKAVLGDWSRRAGWWLVFGLFGFCHLIGPEAVGRQLAKMERVNESERRDGAGRRERRAEARRLRISQQAREMFASKYLNDVAMNNLEEALREKGIPVSMLNQVDGPETARKAADMFGRSLEEVERHRRRPWHGLGLG